MIKQGDCLKKNTARGRKRRMKMFCYECADKVEVTTDKNIVNELLRDGRAIIDVIATHKKRIFVLVRILQRGAH